MRLIGYYALKERKGDIGTKIERILSRLGEMFEIYQSHHNPKKDIDRAIRLHRDCILLNMLKRLSVN